MKLTALFTLSAFVAAMASAALPARAQTVPPMKAHPKMAVSAAKKGGEGKDEKSYPDQASVAAKTAFASVPAAVVAKAKALDAHDLAPAGKLIGKSGSFQGTVTKVYKPDNNGVVILDFDEEYKTALTATVRPDDYKAFPDLNTLNGKHVFVTGTFTDYKGHAEITMTKPSQIKTIK